MIDCCVAIMAYNEEANIGPVLNALLAQVTNIARINEIVVVASGCTDRTGEVVEGFIAKDNRIHLIQQPTREGKASAINLLLRSTRQEVIILHNADNISLPDTIESLVIPFVDPEVGMVGGHPVPINSRSNFMGFGAHLLWELHHQRCLQHPKMGELVAFRNIFRQIPGESAVDEASIEPLIIGQGMRLLYAPNAIIRNRGPETVHDYMTQRRRIFAGHLYVRDLLGYRVSTMKGAPIIGLYIKNMRLDWRYFIWGPAFVALEVFARLKGAYDYKVWKRKPFAWTVIESTKDLEEVSRQPCQGV